MNVPGFVDLQVNGYKGVDFSSPELTEEDFVYACRELIRQGTVAFLPTIITSPRQTYEKNIRLISRAMDRVNLKGHLLGIHLEGPFISPENGVRGAHNLKWVQQPDLNLLNNFHDWSRKKIKLLTIAAELEGADEICRHASSIAGLMPGRYHTLGNEKE